MSPGVLAFLSGFKREARGMTTGGGFTVTYGPWVSSRILNDPLGTHLFRWPRGEQERHGS